MKPTRYKSKHELILAYSETHQRWIFDPCGYRVETLHFTWSCISGQPEKLESLYYDFTHIYVSLSESLRVVLAGVGSFDLHRRSKESKHNKISRHTINIARQGNNATFDLSTLNNHESSTNYRKRYYSPKLLHFLNTLFY